MAMQLEIRIKWGDQIEKNEGEDCVGDYSVVSWLQRSR